MKKHIYALKLLFVFFCIALLCGMFACSKEKRDIKTPLLENAVRLSSEKDSEKIKAIYTAGTVAAAKQYTEITGGTDILSGMDRKLFAAGAKWNIIEENKEGLSAKVIILITAHPARNMIGYRAEIPLLFEDGAWRIDRENTIKNILKKMK